MSVRAAFVAPPTMDLAPVEELVVVVLLVWAWTSVATQRLATATVNERIVRVIIGSFSLLTDCIKRYVERPRRRLEPPRRSSPLRSYLYDKPKVMGAWEQSVNRNMVMNF